MNAIIILIITGPLLRRTNHVSTSPKTFIIAASVLNSAYCILHSKPSIIRRRVGYYQKLAEVGYSCAVRRVRAGQPSCVMASIHVVC